jgi:hypothetical protein
LNPIKNLNLACNFLFVRHGNSSETLPANEALRYLLAKPEVYATDGSIYQHTFNDQGYLGSAWNKLNFLNQDHKMYILQGGLDADYTFGKYKWGQLSVKAGYTAEFIINKGVDENMFPGGLVSYKDGVYYCNEVQYDTADDIVNHFKGQWVDNLKNQFNNYLYFGVQYRW